MYESIDLRLAAAYEHYRDTKYDDLRHSAVVFPTLKPRGFLTWLTIGIVMLFVRVSAKASSILKRPRVGWKMYALYWLLILIMAFFVDIYIIGPLHQQSALHLHQTSPGGGDL